MEVCHQFAGLYEGVKGGASESFSADVAHNVLGFPN